MAAWNSALGAENNAAWNTYVACREGENAGSGRRRRSALDHGRLDRAEPLANPAREDRGTVMRALRLSLAGAVVLALLGGTSGTVLAQEEAEGSGRVAMEIVDWLGEGTDETGAYWNAARVEASDSRLSGTGTENWNCQAGSGFEMCVGTWRIENEGGTWLGRIEGFNHPTGAHDWTVLEGQGDYEGLTAIRVISETPDSELMEMVIIDFEMPEQPEPKLPPTE